MTTLVILRIRVGSVVLPAGGKVVAAAIHALLLRLQALGFAIFLANPESAFKTNYLLY